MSAPALGADDAALLGVVGRQLVAVQHQLDALTAAFALLHARLIPDAAAASPTTAPAPPPAPFEDPRRQERYPTFGAAHVG